MATSENSAEDQELIRKRIRATVYGNCIGDAIGLLTEFMTKETAKKFYKRPLEFKHKVDERHQSRWAVGDWTDDSDQMFLIMRSLIENKGEANPRDFAAKLRVWMQKGFPELNDSGGLGIGTTTVMVTTRDNFAKDPQEAAKQVWIQMKRNAAPNGAVMRTSVVGTCHFQDLEKVMENAITVASITHYDPRCKASSVAVSIAVSLMLQGESDVPTIIDKAYEYASRCLETEEEKKDLRQYMDCKDLEELKLGESSKIGYTYKCLGAGFWALKQENFRDALEEITMNGGDADTNGAVAGALLACRLGDEKLLPKSWMKNLCYIDWLETELEKYFKEIVFPGCPYVRAPPAKSGSRKRCSIIDSSEEPQLKKKKR